MPDTNVPADPRILSYARAVAAAEDKSVTTAAVLAAAAEKHSRAAVRLIALKDQRAAIVARRTVGDTRPTDGADLALIEADTEGLNSIVGDLSAAAEAARSAADEANRALITARETLRYAEGEVLEHALIEHADTLLARLSDTAARIEQVRTELGRPRPSWTPKREVMEQFRRLKVMRGEYS